VGNLSAAVFTPTTFFFHRTSVIGGSAADNYGPRWKTSAHERRKAISSTTALGFEYSAVEGLGGLTLGKILEPDHKG